MHLVDFMNAHKDNWQVILSQSPYNLSIHSDGDYYILKYNMINSDFSNPLCLEARGSIFRRENDTWICVARAFDKFFNYGERYSSVNDIDWTSAVVLQKVDGSLCKIFYDRGEWHVSTNGTIRAEDASAGDITYLDLFNKALQGIDWDWDALNKDYCYMFELTSPFNHIVIKYEGIHLWYLGCRNMRTGNEESIRLDFNGLLYPHVYSHHSLADCIAAAHEMGDDEEGYVVVDANFNRIKIKGDEYLRLHKLRGNGAITVQRVIELWQSDSLDDFVAYYPEFTNFVNSVLTNLRNLINDADSAYDTIIRILCEGDSCFSRKLFAQYAKMYIPSIQPFLYARLDRKCENATDFYSHMLVRKLASYLNIISPIGVLEDE